MELIFWEFAQNMAGIIIDCAHNDEIAQTFKKILSEAAWIMTRFNYSVDSVEEGGRVASGERVDRLIEKGAIGIAQKLNCNLVSNTLFAGTSEELAKN